MLRIGRFGDPGAATGDFERAYGERYGSAALLPGARLEVTTLRAEILIPVGVASADRGDR